MNDLARLDAELKKYELAYQMTTPDFLLRVADPHDDLSDVEDASFWRATYEIAEKIRTEGDNTVSDLVARLRANGTSLYDQAADRIEELEAELAEAKAKIERYEHWIFSCNDCGPAEYAQRRLLSPQGSLAGSPIQAKDDQC